MPIIQIPPDAKTIELSNSVMWLDENGVLYSRPKPGPYIRQTREAMVEDMKKVKALIGYKKVCMIVEGHSHVESPRENDRDFIADQLVEIAKAMAILTPSAVSRMVTNLFFLFKPAPYPMRMFLSVSDAKAWLQECVKKGPMTPVL